MAEALARGQRPAEIAAALGVSKATVIFHLARLGARPAGKYQARRAVCGTLARSGIRASELCDLRIGRVRLHDSGGARFRIPDAKTEAGVRELQMSPELVEEFVSHFDRLRPGRAASGGLGHGIGHEPSERANDDSSQTGPAAEETGDLQGRLRNGETRTRIGTPRDCEARAVRGHRRCVRVPSLRPVVGRHAVGRHRCRPGPVRRLPSPRRE